MVSLRYLTVMRYFKFYRYILCKKYYVFVYKVIDIFNTLYMVFTRSPTKVKKWWFLKKSQIILQS